MVALSAVLPIFPTALQRDTLSCMQVKEDEIFEFMEIWREEFRESITVEDARQCATALLDLYALLTSSWSEERS